MLDKPPGLPVHAGPRGGPSVEDCFPLLSRRKDGPWLVHRLDADTAGCLVVALRRAALIAAQAEFAAGRARKTYWAVVHGVPPPQPARSTRRCAGTARKAGWRMVSDAAGQRAVTDWRRVRPGRRHRLAGTHPRTGRTHQVRVHCALLGCPCSATRSMATRTVRCTCSARAHKLTMRGDGNRKLPMPGDGDRQVAVAGPCHRPGVPSAAGRHRRPAAAYARALARCGWVHDRCVDHAPRRSRHIGKIHHPSGFCRLGQMDLDAAGAGDARTGRSWGAPHRWSTQAEREIVPWQHSRAARPKTI